MGYFRMGLFCLQWKRSGDGNRVFCALASCTCVGDTISQVFTDPEGMGVRWPLQLGLPPSWPFHRTFHYSAVVWPLTRR